MGTLMNRPGRVRQIESRSLRRMREESFLFLADRYVRFPAASRIKAVITSG
jgi:hypothetical protein